MPRKILIVDDSEINRLMLKNTLCRDYEILEAGNGREALQVMHQNSEALSAVLLDIIMPEADGYEVLRSVREDMELAQIPVIMVTGSEDEQARVKALALGANDFILKPFNVDIVKHCLKNNITMRETVSILNAIQRDKLTGLYNREAFFEKVSGMIMEHEPGYYILSCFDVDNFKLINDQYGTVEGDRILREISRAVAEDMADIGGIAGRISGDNFAVLLPTENKELSITRLIQQNRLAFSDKQALVFSVGRYIITDPTLSASAIYDRAYIAKQSVKGRYDAHIAYFDDIMLEKIVHSQQIVADMDEALASGQFEAWFQPQRNHATGALVGAEALVRWRHPHRGLISPGDFIPVFEQNGFIYELDKYIWEEVCCCLQKWIREGRNPMPVSVNISRYDVFRTDFIDVLTGLVHKYCIPVELLRLEITESAFARSTKEIVGIVKQLIDRGFIIEIDDFGSGYSSLNTLKSVPAQVVKLDMRFLVEEDDDAMRGGNILESVVRMAKWLGMAVIAEGVEDRIQADYLTSVGCSYIQGYLYARPMPVAEYEEYCRGVEKEERLLSMETVDNLDNNAFWNPRSMDTLIFNSYVGAACIFEYYNRNIELLRVNTKFTTILGDGTISIEDTLRLNWLDSLTPESRAAVREVLRRSCETREEYTGEYVFLNIPGAPAETYLRSTMRVIATAGERMLVYCTSENITAEKHAIAEKRKMQSRLELVTNNIPGGIAIYEGNPAALDQIKLTYFSDGVCRLFGFTREEYEKQAAEDPLSLVFPDDISRMHRSIKALVEDGIPMDFIYRASVSGGASKWINVKAVMGEPNGDALTVNAIFFDVTDQKNALEKLRVSEEESSLAVRLGGNVICRYLIADRTLKLSPEMAESLSLPETIHGVPFEPVRLGMISAESVSAYIGFFEAILHGSKAETARFRQKYSGDWRWLEAKSATVFSEEGKPVKAMISFFDVTEKLEKEAVSRKWQQALEAKQSAAYMLFRCNLNRNASYDSAEGSLVTFDFDKAGTNFNQRAQAYLQQCVCPQDRERYAAFVNADILLAGYYRGKRSDVLEYREMLPEGKSRWLRLTIELVEHVDSKDVDAYLLYEDIDEVKQEELLLQQQAEADTLTGLLNRGAFAEKFSRMIGGKTEKGLSALFLVDLDSFKQVNDYFGHAAGDETLIEMGQKLGSIFRGEDLICRLGEDEFMVYMCGLTQLSAVKERASLICALLHKSFSMEVQLSASVGIALYPEHGDDLETLYRKADMALRHVKESGKDSFALYEENMKVQNTARESAEEAESTPDEVHYTVPKRRMLIVEDNEINRDYLTNLFQEEFLIDTAAEGTAALTRLRRYGSGISIVLLDLLMPGLDGFTVLRKMREDLTMQAIPVIVVSGMNERETCLEAIRNGASDYITKPVDADLLKLRVASALSKAENEQLRAQNRYLALKNEETKRLAEARRNSEELSVALHAAERADLAKSQFLSSMSHEIRTPLNAVIGYNTIARSEMAGAKTEAERRQANMKVMDCLTKSEVASKHLLTIINDVLDMSAIESGKLKVEQAAFDFRSLITSLTVMFFAQARTKGVHFDVLFDKPTEEWYIGDQMRINQILTNLLSNAVKFTPENGSVTLTITENAVDEHSTSFCFVVSDTGIGMKQEYLEHIWTPFEQAETSISRRFGGTGLGLSITKNLVDLMNGTITVESESGVGSKFTVNLTFIRTEQLGRQLDSYDFSNVKALVADDDRSTCDYIKLLFDRCGAHCEAFTSGSQAVSAFAEAKERGTPFNMCLIDWRMPQMDGFATITEIRRIASKNLPIVVVTAYDFTEVSDQAEVLGINRFISKPLFQSSLFDLLATISGKQPSMASKKNKDYDFEGARVLLAEDNNMNMEVARHILLSAEIAVDSAWNGQEVIDIFEASKEGTYGAILMDIHMPVVDGYQATRMIRASEHPDAKSIPIIAMTADVFAEDIAEAHNAGMNDHIAKPIDVEGLFAMLSIYMEGKTE